MFTKQLLWPLSYVGTLPAGGLGWGLPAAIGLKLARPERTVIAAVGDGAYLFANPAACHHAMAMHDIPVLTVICANRKWTAVQGSALGMYPAGHAADIVQDDGVFRDQLERHGPAQRSAPQDVGRGDILAEQVRPLGKLPGDGPEHRVEIAERQDHHHRGCALHDDRWPRRGPAAMRDPQKRERQAVAMAEALEKQAAAGDRHVILAGDLGDSESASVRFWTGRQSLDGASVCYRDAWESRHPNEAGPTLTPDNPLVYDWDWPFRRVDLLFVRCGEHGGPTLEIAGCDRVFTEPVVVTVQTSPQKDCTNCPARPLR